MFRERSCYLRRPVTLRAHAACAAVAGRHMTIERSIQNRLQSTDFATSAPWHRVCSSLSASISQTTNTKEYKVMNLPSTRRNTGYAVSPLASLLNLSRDFDRLFEAPFAALSRE